MPVKQEFMSATEKPNNLTLVVMCKVFSIFPPSGINVLINSDQQSYQDLFFLCIVKNMFSFNLNEFFLKGTTEALLCPPETHLLL